MINQNILQISNCKKITRCDSKFSPKCQQRKVSNLYQNMTAEGSDFYKKKLNIKIERNDL